MFFRRLVWPLCAALVAATHLAAEEWNAWPFAVQQVRPDQTVESAEYVGPFLFEKVRADGSEVKGFRPFYLWTKEGNKETNALFYPFFTWQKEGDYRYFTFFELINFRRQTDSDAQTVRNFDVWPFYFSRNSGDPENKLQSAVSLSVARSRAVLEKTKSTSFFFHYTQTSKRVARTPCTRRGRFLRFIDGAGDHGFEFWAVVRPSRP